MKTIRKRSHLLCVLKTVLCDTYMYRWLNNVYAGLIHVHKVKARET